MKLMVIQTVIGALDAVTKEAGGLGNKSTSGNYPIYSISEISQDIKKSPGIFRRIAVTQTPVGNTLLILVRKYFKREDSWRLEGIFCPSYCSERSSAKKLSRSNTNNNNRKEQEN